MAAFEKARQYVDLELMLRLLTILSEKPESTQRDLATEMGISLGMMVSYMKSSVKKGLIRTKQVAPRRWAYFVTPKGFAEKSRMISGYLSRSMTFFRETRTQLENLFGHCQQRGMQKIAMVGSSDVAEIAFLVSQKFSISLELMQNVDDNIGANTFDAFFVTDVNKPQETFDTLKKYVAEEKIFCIATLCITRKRISSA